MQIMITLTHEEILEAIEDFCKKREIPDADIVIKVSYDRPNGGANITATIKVETEHFKDGPYR